ncbi:F-box/LRR-repeat protein 20-like [Centruroides vittatus]|uniref:F-box/LRR-repeat protein 20-like n=1 Tax=Centruroides vittatus TaxID=120091 RepID=UPI00350FB6E1
MQNGSEFTNSSLQKCDSEEESEPMFATTFDDLPNELQLKIFSYLTTAEVCRYVAPVCREWREKAKDPVLWKVIVLKDVHVDYLDRFCRILTRATMLKCLTLRALSCPLQDFARCSLSFPLLTHLDLGFCNDVNPQIISVFVSNCRLISVLNVEGCLGINQAAVNIISTLKYLRSLNLSHCTFLSNPAIVRLAENCPRLQELNVDGITTITDSAICLLCENLQDSLQHIELDGEELTDKSYKCIGQCRNLIKLGISFAEMITDRSLMYLKKLSKLRYLKLRRGTHLTAPALKDIFVGPELKYLTFLEFDSLMIEDDGIKSMTECCTELRYLGLQWCWKITDVGLDFIVTNCHNLRGIDLLGLYRITGTALLKVPSNMKHLGYLNLEQCNEIIDSLLCKLKREVPELVIKDYYGEFVIPSADSGDENEEKENEKN